MLVYQRVTDKSDHLEQSTLISCILHWIFLGFSHDFLRFAAVFQGFNACISAASLETQWQVSLRLAEHCRNT